MSFRISRLTPDQREKAARLIHRSLVDWYERNLNQGHRFGDAWEPFLVFPDIYEALDPGCGVTAVDEADGRLLGVCFYHPRETHVAVGIVSTAPDAGGKGAARAMMEEVLRIADAAGLPARLVSSAVSLDSFSLYTRLGFTPRGVFQDMVFGENSRLTAPPTDPAGRRVRPARAEDIPAMVELEFELRGIRREKDYHFFLANESGIWRAWVLETPDGRIDGFLVAVRSAGPRMLGPGVMRDADAALTLILAAHAAFPGEFPVFLVPADQAELVRELYARGARNLELHLGQYRGGDIREDGVYLPTFMPETG